MKICN